MRNAVSHNENWHQAWRSPEPRKRYDVVIVGGGGHVTSSYHSACLGHPIALALVGAGRARRGDVIHAALRDGRHVPVKVVSPVFYDPKGERQHV